MKDNEKLLSTIKQVEDEKNKMYSHWKFLRVIEAKKKKDRHQKIAQGIL